jgi:1,2-diacylglycerol 3-beta-glucosyltransferase
VTGPEVLTLLYIVAAVMICHSLWLFTAQGRWQRKTRRAALKEANAAASGALAPLQDADGVVSNWQPWIDIFISAKNEQRVIENTIRNFFNLDYDKFFLWIIDDCSTDQTPVILENLKKEFPRLRILLRAPGSYPGKSAALNDALPLAKGEVVAVFDADAYVAPYFFDLMLPVLEPEGIGAVQAQKKIYEHQEGFLVNCQASEYAVDTYFQVGRDIIGGTVELRGNGQMIKRAALVDVGGWNNKAITDDLDLTMRLP